jgi:hypothetical protein
MAAFVTEAYSGSSFVRGAVDSGWKATRVFHVVGAANKSAAINAVATVNFPSGAAGAYPGSTHPENSRLVCDDVGCDDNPALRKVTANYSITQLGQFDPLLNKVRWRWQPGNEQLLIDRDGYGNPITNSAGLPFGQPPSKFNSTLCVTALRAEPFFDVAKSLQFKDRTNSAAFRIPGAGTLQPGQMFCENIFPQEDVYDGLVYVTVQYVFQLRPGRKLPGASTNEYDGFFQSFLNQGSYAWATDPDASVGTALGRIVNKKGLVIDHDVALNDNGTPVDASLKVQLADYASPLTPVPSPTTPPQNVARVTGTNGAVYLAYRVYDVADFNSLTFV